MAGHDKSRPERFGGPWTQKKLNILESYLKAYTTALKQTPFKLMYIDAFAGTGLIRLRGDDPDGRNFMKGSAERAIRIDDKPFDKLIFVEKDSERCKNLESLRRAHPDRKIDVINYDANTFLRSNLREGWQEWRGVLFLDPFATEVEWSTIKTISDFNALDTWILFPTSAIARMLPNSKRPEDIATKWANRLTKVFGDENWRKLYQESPQADLFGGSNVERKPGVEGIISIYKKKLSNLFGHRFLRKSRTLRNSKNSPLFEFIFCVGHPKGIDPAKRIAKHIMEHL